jgi:hypothetical protein
VKVRTDVGWRSSRNPHLLSTTLENWTVATLEK